MLGSKPDPGHIKVIFDSIFSWVNLISMCLFLIQNKILKQKKIAFEVENKNIAIYPTAPKIPQ